MILGGITVLQGYIYFPRTKDKLSLQIVAGIMLALDFTSSALVAQSVYYYLVPHFGSLLPLNSLTTELSADCFISTMITFISQMYFVWQIYTVARGRGSLFVPAVVGIFAICAFAFGTACTVAMVVHKHLVLGERSTVFSIFFGLAKGFGALTDIVATAALCTYLSSSKTGVAQTNSLIKTLMHFIIHRGILVTLIQSLLLIMFFAVPSHLYWLAFHVNVTKLYVNVFFAMLNARITLNEKIQNGAVMRMDDTFRLTGPSETYSRGHIETNHGNFGGEKLNVARMPVINVTRVVDSFWEAESSSGRV